MLRAVAVFVGLLLVGVNEPINRRHLGFAASLARLAISAHLGLLALGMTQVVLEFHLHLAAALILPLGNRPHAGLDARALISGLSPSRGVHSALVGLCKAVGFALERPAGGLGGFRHGGGSPYRRCGLWLRTTDKAWSILS